MEYSLTHSGFPQWQACESSLNPYSNGILSDLMLNKLTFKCSGLNPYSNGILSDNQKESILDFLLYFSPLLETRIRQRVSSIRKIFSQMYLFSSFIPNKNEHLFA